MESAMQVQTQWQQQQDQLQKQQLRNEQQIERRPERQQHGLLEKMQALADRLALLENLKPQTPKYEQRPKHSSQHLMSEHSEALRSPSSKQETLISRVHFEESLEHEKQRIQREFDDKRDQQTHDADVGQKNWLTNAQNALEERERMLKSQWSNFEQELKKREERKLEREAMATGMQNQMLTVFQAALSQIARYSATGMQSESLRSPDPATLNPVRAVAAKNSQTPIVGASPTVASVQQIGAVDQKREVKRKTRPVKSATRQESSNASQTPPAVRRTEPQVARKITARKEEATSSSSKRPQPKKAKEKSDPPPDDPDDSEPSDRDNDASREGSSDSSDAESFSSEDEEIGMTTTTTTADETTIRNCRSYIGYTNLEKFDEKAFRDNRVNRWERFSNMASQGSWSYTMKICQFRSRMPTATMDWFTQLPKSTRHDWKQMSRRFRKLYIGTTGSYSERYFRMKKTDHETPLQFFYHLNAAAVKAEVKFKSSSKLRESHIQRFIKKLRNDQLKTALEGHRILNITDLERALRRHKDVWREEVYDSPAPKKPSFRTDNVHHDRTQNRGPTRRQERAFVTQGDAEPTQDSEFQLEPQNPEVFAEQAEAHSKSSSELLNSGIDGAVFRAAENQHWKSPNLHPGQGVARPEHWDVFCEKCKKWGHPKANCWTGMISAEVKMVKLQEKPKPLDMTLKFIGNSAVVMNTVASDPEEPETRPEPAEQTHPDLSPEVETLDRESMADVENNTQVPEPSVDVQSQTSCSTPVQRLEAEYAGVMRVSAEELDLEPAVYLREGTCIIDEANVEVPGVTTPDMEAKMRGILKRHRIIFQGDGNAAPAPARGVVCDIDGGEAKPVALRARQIAEPFLVKVFELLKKLLEAELIEHSESEWSSPIVIVLKKNGIDIRMYFKSAMWFMSLDMASGFWAV
ncbi:hypothetical protein PHMEG_00012663 [Phytophthora megakarya]|uniref:Reverse transcriptase n=1 Tax=Phytophthora megakarya TaxID=4795 RepID=A0A225W8N4_9STRA|nr:hypothetical protein PHMEG_00012663 [Phytophthora megakarya]